MSKRPGDLGYAAGWCIHYRYNRNLKKGEPDTCEAGVNYERWRGVTHGTQPCFLDDKTGENKPDALPCEYLRRPTAEEIAAHEEWLESRMNRMGVVMRGIQEWRRRYKGKSVQDIVECPVCKGRLHLSISGYNGHVHGHCETADCVSWME